MITAHPKLKNNKQKLYKWMDFNSFLSGNHFVILLVSLVDFLLCCKACLLFHSVCNKWIMCSLNVTCTMVVYCIINIITIMILFRSVQSILQFIWRGGWFFLLLMLLFYSSPAYSSSARMHFVSCIYNI